MFRSKPVSFSALLLAAGSGTRAGAGPAKQWRLLAGKPVVRWSAEGLLEAGAAPLVVVVPEDAFSIANESLAGLTGWSLIAGGATRAQSSTRGLANLRAANDHLVLIHDAGRPFVRPRHVASLLEALASPDIDGAVPALPMADTLKRRGEDGRAITADREGLWRVQTPQAFRYGALARALADFGDDPSITDDAMAVERAGGRIVLTAGDPLLFKLTWPEDLEMADLLATATRRTRIGQGFDAHRFGPGESVWLCGVQIAHNRGLVGHSDADAGLHALTDALFGAIGRGDIGDHFPPSDPQWRGVASEVFLRRAVQLVQAAGGRISNVDVTLICEEPRIKPHREAMRAMIAAILEVDSSRVSVKATTTEAMGFTGRREGLAAQAVAAVELPEAI